MPAVKALIFDFDGLILDTETPEYDAWYQIYAEHGCDLPLALWADCIGRGHEQIKFDPYEYLSECTGMPIDTEVIRAQKRRLFHQGMANRPPRDGIVAYLDAAKARGLGTAVASSSKRDWVEGYLLSLGLLSRFDLTRCADDVTRTKPDPEVYLSALDGLGITAADAIAFEDSPNGTLAAHRAGIFTVAVPNPLTATLEFPHADHRIESMDSVELAEILRLRSGQS